MSIGKRFVTSFDWGGGTREGGGSGGAERVNKQGIPVDRPGMIRIADTPVARGGHGSAWVTGEDWSQPTDVDLVVLSEKSGKFRQTKGGAFEAAEPATRKRTGNKGKKSGRKGGS